MKKPKKVKTYVAHCIQYDFTGGGKITKKQMAAIPTAFIVETDEREEVVNIISDATGWLVSDVKISCLPCIGKIFDVRTLKNIYKKQLDEAMNSYVPAVA